MPSFPRTILPRESSSFVMPGALGSKGQSGKSQRRSTVQRGRTWTEVYRPFLAGSAEGRAFITTINDYWMNGTTFTIDHRAYLTHNGSGTGTARVMGASQTGTSLITDGWTGSNPVLKKGDLISIAGLAHTFDVNADAPNLAATVTTLTINPPILVGGAPADNAIITYTGATLAALIDAPPDIPLAGPDTYIVGLTLAFCEAIT